MRKRTVMAALREQRRASLGLLGQLEEEQWAQPCPTAPRWHAAPWLSEGVSGGDLAAAEVRVQPPFARPRVRDLAAHLLAVDEAAWPGRLLRREPRAAGWLGAGVAWVPEEVAVRASLPAGALLAGLATAGDRLFRIAELMPSVPPRLRLARPRSAGRRSLPEVLAARLHHEWLHAYDIAVAAGPAPKLPLPLPPAIGDVLIDAVLGALPARALPSAARATGVVRLIVDVAAAASGPPVPPAAAGAGGQRPPAPDRRIWSVDFGRRQYGPRVAVHPDATVRLDPATLALIAGGRMRWRDVAPGLLSIEGDQAVAADLLDAVGDATAAWA